MNATPSIREHGDVPGGATPALVPGSASDTPAEPSPHRPRERGVEA